MSENLKMEVLLRSALGAVPYIGTALNEVIFEHRSRVKQNRLNKFISLLFDYLSTHSEIDFNIEDIDKEDLGDVLESVVRKVVETGSEQKLKHLRNILMGHIKANTPDVDLTQSYLELTTNLSHIQIRILLTFAKNKVKVDKQMNKIILLEGKIQTAKQKVNEFEKKAKVGAITLNESILGATEEKDSILREKIKVEQKLKEFKRYKNADYYKIDTSEFMYYQRDLISKGLLLEIFTIQMGSSSSEDSEKEITSFGEKYIKFIEQS